MPDTAWPLIQTERVEPLIVRADLEPASQEALTADMPPRVAVEALRGKGLLLDALRLLSQALPPRDAVWWACRCLRALPAPKPGSSDARALSLAEQWTLDPTYERACEAYAVAQQIGFTTPYAWAATGPLWAGPNMNNNPDLPPVEPDPSLAGKAACGALCLGAVADDPPKPAERHAQFLDLGVAVATGADSWKSHIG